MARKYDLLRLIGMTPQQLRDILVKEHGQSADQLRGQKPRELIDLICRLQDGSAAKRVATPTAGRRVNINSHDAYWHSGIAQGDRCELRRFGLGKYELAALVHPIHLSRHVPILIGLMLAIDGKNEPVFWEDIAECYKV